MGNCQAIDNASLVIQHPSGRVERLYSTISAAEVTKLNPGHYVALLLTTTLYSSRNPSTSAPTKQNQHQHPRNDGPGAVTSNAPPLRITRIKLLRPTDTLAVGHVYRLITTQEVMKVLMAKKNGKINNDTKKLMAAEEPAGKHEATTTRSNQSERAHHQMKTPSKDRRRTAAPASAAAIRPRGWHPSLNSISEAST